MDGVLNTCSICLLRGDTACRCPDAFQHLLRSTPSPSVAIDAPDWSLDALVGWNPSALVRGAWDLLRHN